MTGGANSACQKYSSAGSPGAHLTIPFGNGTRENDPPIERALNSGSSPSGGGTCIRVCNESGLIGYDAILHIFGEIRGHRAIALFFVAASLLFGGISLEALSIS